MGKNEEIVIDKMFSKGFLDDKGRNKTPDFFADALSNVRIKNGGITSRLWTDEIYTAWLPNPIRWINTNSITSGTRIYYTANSNFCYIDTAVDPIVSTVVWSIGTDSRCRFINYGAYIIILTGAGAPRYYNGLTLTQVNSGTEITANVNPEFWIKFAWFTMINSKLNRNIAYYSKPITLTNQEYCYHRLGSNSWSIDWKDELIGMTSNLNAVWWFTKSKILRIDKSNVTTTWGVTSPYAIEFAQGYDLASNDSIVNAGNVIMFLTKNKKIGTINYKATVTEPQMSIISDTPWSSIDGFMQRELWDDQSSSFWFYDRNQNIVKWFVRSRRSLVNDLCLIYDIQNDTFLLDDSKFYSCMTSLGDNIYAGSALSHRILQDEIDDSDCWDAIEWSFETTDIVVAWPTSLKTFVGKCLAWQTNSLSVINWKIYVDENLVFNKNINWSSITWTVIDWIGWSSIGWEPIGWEIVTSWDDLVDFEKVIGVNNLRATGKKIKSVFSWWQVGQNFILDYLSIKAIVRARPLRSDTSFN